MPQHVFKMLDNLLDNGTDPETRALGEGIKVALEILSDVEKEVNSISGKLDKHIDDKTCHTPKGILVRNEVIFWWATLTILVSAIVAHAPELIKLIPVP